MRILLISPYFPPQQAAASLRVYAYARYWALAGEDVTVLTTRKHSDQQGLDFGVDDFHIVELSYTVPKWKQRLRSQSKVNHLASSEQSSGSRFNMLARFRDRAGIFSSVRMPDLTDHWVRNAIGWCLNQQPWDVVLSSSGPYTAHLVASEVRRRSRADFWVAEFRDLWVKNEPYHGLFPFTILERVLEGRCLRGVDLLVTVSKTLATKLRRQSDHPVTVIYNGYEPDELESLPRESVFGDDALLRLVFTGTLYPKGQNIEPLFAAISKLRRDRPNLADHLRVVVAGRNNDCWRAAAEKYDLADLLILHGMVHRSEALRMQRDADALLLFDWHDPAHGVLTSKVFEYLSVSTPILLIGGDQSSPIAEIINQTRRGCVLGNNEEAIVETLVRLVEGKVISSESAKREVISQYTRKRQSLSLLQNIRDMLNERQRRSLVRSDEWS